MTKTIYLNFDTINSSYTTSGNVYNTQFTILPALRNVSKIFLKSIEIPVGFHNVRSGSDLNQFNFTLNGTTYNITLTAKVYTSMSALLVDLYNAIIGLSLSTTMVIAISTRDTAKLMVTLGSAQPLTINFTNFSKYILGLANLSSISAISYSVQNYLLNCDNYISFSLANIPTISNNNFNGVISSFKIPLNCTSNVVFYEQDNSSFTQYLEITDPNYVVNNLNVQIMDRWGNIILSQGLDFSFTLAFIINDV
jgi:hypothetical protein